MADPADTATFRIPVYSGRVLLCFTREAYEKALELLNDAPDPCLREYAGCMLECFEGKKTKRKVFLIGWFDKQLGTLIHELSHTTFRVLRHAEVGISHANDEAYAYLMDSLFSKAVQASRRALPKGNRAHSAT